MKRLLLILIALLTLVSLSARRQRTGPSRLIPPPAESVYDTIAAPEGSLRFSGYDKPNSATRETFFVTNLTEDSIPIEGFIVELEYSDMRGRRLHCATHCVMVSLSAGETQMVSVPAWDRNHAFHYYRSPAPVRRPSTPYRVSSRAVSLVVSL